MFTLFLQKIARTVLFLTLFISGVTPALAWTGPTTAPPGNNVSTPVNVSSAAQTKAGYLGVNGGYSGGLSWPFSVGGAANNWTAIFNWPYNTTPSGSMGILAGGTYSQFENPSGYYAVIAQGTYGLQTNGNVWANDVYDNATGRWLSSSSGVAFGGMWEEYAVGGCIAGNPWTGGCSCPGFAPNARWAAVGNSGNGSYAFELYYCTN